MLIMRRLTPLCSSLALFTIFELFFFIPELFAVWVLLLLTLLTATILFLMGKGLITPWSRLRFLVAPVTLLASAAFFILFVSQGIAPHLIALGISFLIFLYLEHMFLYIWLHENYAPFSLEYTTGAIAVLSLFFATSSLFATHALLEVSLSMILPLVFGVSLVIYGYTLWMNKFPLRTNLPILITSSLMVTELFWAASTLPLHFIILGCLTTLTGYTMFETIRAYLLKTLTPRNLQRILLFAGTLAALLLTTARWRL